MSSADNVSFFLFSSESKLPKCFRGGICFSKPGLVESWYYPSIPQKHLILLSQETPEYFHFLLKGNDSHSPLSVLARLISIIAHILSFNRSTLSPNSRSCFSSSRFLRSLAYRQSSGLRWRSLRVGSRKLGEYMMMAVRPLFGRRGEGSFQCSRLLRRELDSGFGGLGNFALCTVPQIQKKYQLAQTRTSDQRAGRERETSE